MGLTSRNKSGRFIGGSRLNVPGQGIYTVVRQPNDKAVIKSQFERTPRPTSTPTPTPTLTSTPTPTLTPTLSLTPTPTPTFIDACYLATEDYIDLLTENGLFIIVDCPITPTPTPSVTPTLTPTVTPIDVCYLSTEDYIDLLTENNLFIIVDCPITPTPTPTSTLTPTLTPTQTEQVIVDAILIDGGSGYLIPGNDEYLIYIDP